MTATNRDGVKWTPAMYAEEERQFWDLFYIVQPRTFIRRYVDWFGENFRR